MTMAVLPTLTVKGMLGIVTGIHSNQHDSAWLREAGSSPSVVVEAGGSGTVFIGLYLLNVRGLGWAAPLGGVVWGGPRNGLGWAGHDGSSPDQ